MTYNEFLQWLQAYLSNQRKKAAPAGADVGLPVFKSTVSGKVFQTIGDAVSALNSEGKLSVGYADEPQNNTVLDKDTLDARLRMIGIYEGDRKFADKGDFRFKEGYQGIKKFTADEKGQILFCPEYDRMHEKARLMDAEDERRNQVNMEFPRPKAAGSELFARAYRLYLDVSGTEEARRNNYRLQESLKTETGRKVFISRLLKDVMNVDYTEMFRERTLSEQLDYFAANKRKFDMLYIIPHLVTESGRGSYIMDKALADMLKNFNVIAQSGGLFRSYQESMSRDDYYMLPSLDLESSAKMTGDKCPAGVQAAGGFMVAYFMSAGMLRDDAASINRLAELGGLSPFVSLNVGENNPVTVQAAVDSMKAGKEVTVVPMSEAERNRLQALINNPYGLTGAQVDAINDAADERYRAEKVYEANLAHIEELNEAGAVGQLRKELEYNQIMLGQTDRAENGAVYEKHMARILVLGNLIGKAEKLQEEYRDAPVGELDGILEALTDPEQLDANTEIVMKSGAFRDFMEHNSAEDLDGFAIRQDAIGTLSPNRYGEIREVSELFEKQFALENNDAYAAGEVEKAREPEAARKWYASFGEELRKQGIDIHNRYAMGLIRNVEVPDVMPEDVETERMTCDEIFDITMGMGEGSGYAFMSHDSADKYLVPAPEDRSRRLEWINNNLQTYDGADAKTVLFLYRQAKANMLTLRSTSFGNDWANPPKFIKVDKNGNALITPVITELLAEAVPDPLAPKNDKYKEFYSDEEMAKIEGMSSALIGLQMGKEELITDAHRKGLDLLKYRELNEATFAPNAEKMYILTATLHPEWMDTPEKAEHFYRVYEAMSIPMNIRTDEDNRLAEAMDVPNEVTFEIEKDLLKKSKAENLTELMKSGKVTRADGTEFSKTDSMKFLLDVATESYTNAIMLELPDKHTGKIEKLPYIKYLDFGMMKAGNVSCYKNALSEIRLTQPEEVSPGFKKFSEALTSAHDTFASNLANGQSFDLLDTVARTVSDLKSSAKEYCKELSEKENLSAADIENLKNLVQLTILTDAADRKEPFAKTDMVRAVALKLVCEQGVRLLSTEGTVTIPAHGDIAAHQVNAKELGRKLLTDSETREQFVATRMSHTAFVKVFGDKDDETLKQIMKTDDRKLLNAYIDVAKTFERESVLPEEQKELPENPSAAI